MHAAAQRAADAQPVERDDAAAGGREPGDPALVVRHREQTLAVGGEQRAGLEVGAERDDVAGVDRGVGRHRPPRRRRLDRRDQRWPRRGPSRSDPSRWIMPPLCHHRTSVYAAAPCSATDRVVSSPSRVADRSRATTSSTGNCSAESGIERVVMLPTADAFEQPALLVAAAEAWGGRIGVDGRAVDGDDPRRRRRIRSRPPSSTPRRRSFLAGDSASHLRSVLKDTPLFEALSDLRRPRRHADRVRSVRGGALRSDDRPARRRLRARPRVGAGAGGHPRLRGVAPRAARARPHPRQHAARRPADRQRDRAPRRRRGRSSATPTVHGELPDLIVVSDQRQAKTGCSRWSTRSSMRPASATWRNW